MFLYIYATIACMSDEGEPRIDHRIEEIKNRITDLDPRTQNTFISDLFFSQFSAKLNPDLLGQIRDAITANPVTERLQKSSTLENSENTRAKEWLDVITQRGGGFLNGKFYESWIDKDQSPEQVGSGHGFEHYTSGMFGIVKKRINVPGVPGGRVLGLIAQNYNYRASETNFLSIADVDNESSLSRSHLNLPNSVHEKALIYRMWSHINFTPDKRGNSNPPLSMVLFLPSEDADRLTREIRENPDLIEDIFQEKYGFATERGIQRVITDKLRILDFSDEKVKGMSEYDLTESYLNFPTLQFSHPVGEQPK